MEALIKQLEELIANENAIELAADFETAKETFENETRKFEEWARSLRLDLLPKNGVICGEANTRSCGSKMLVEVRMAEDKFSFDFFVGGRSLKELEHYEEENVAYHIAKALKVFPKLRESFKKSFEAQLRKRIDTFIVVD